MVAVSRLRRSGYGAGAALRKSIMALLALIVLSLPAAARQITIAALGDSLTQGYGLPPEQGFVPQLETWLRDKGHDVRIVNAGVSGDTTAGGLARVGWTLTPEVDGVIVALGGNDMLRGIAPDEVRRNLDGILRMAQDKGVEIMLIGYQSPGNFGPEYKQAFDRIYPELAEKYGAVRSAGFLRGKDKEYSLRDLMQCCMQADGLHPNAKGVSLMVEAQGPKVEELIRRIEAR